MKVPYAIAIIVGASLASGVLGWLIFRPRTPDRVDAVYGDLAKRFNLDRSWSIKFGNITQNASQKRCGQVTDSDYQEVYRALDTGIPDLQRRAIGVILDCPPVDKDACFAKVNVVAQTGKTPAIQSWAFGVLWNLSPGKHDEIRREGLASKFPEIVSEAATWTETSTKNKT